MRNKANNKAILKDEDKIRIYTTDILGDSTKFSINYEKIVEDAKRGNTIKVGDDGIELEIYDINVNYLICRVVHGGEISNNMSLTVPGLIIDIPFMNNSDISDIEYACRVKADYLALSSVRNSEDVMQIYDKLIELNDDHMQVISKIETLESLDDLDGIIKTSDGVMIARGDLSTAIPMERVPGIQKQIISKCHVEGKFSIVATDLLSSMENNFIPTKAEISDIANATLDGTDAVLLSDETTIGKYPIESLNTLEKVIKQAEIDVDYDNLLDRAFRSEEYGITGIIAHSVVESANRLKCKAVIAPTMTGTTAKKISRFRPSCPVIAVSPNIETVKSLAIYYSICPVLIDELNSLDRLINKSCDITKKMIDIKGKDKVIITGAYPFKQSRNTNFMKIEEF